MKLIIGAIVGGFAGVYFCQQYTSTQQTTPLCANANGGIPTSLLLGAVAGAVLGEML